MLKLLLDEHISPAVAYGLRRRNRQLVAFYMTEWEDGEFLGQQDSVCLKQAAAQGLTLVTYDRRTIPPLLKSWGKKSESTVEWFLLTKRLSPRQTLATLSEA